MTVAYCIQGHKIVAIIAPIVKDCISTMYCLNFSTIRFVSRNLNSEAHNLFGLAKSCESIT